jgi:predicted DNA-binding antitoxin AbrB/MazE fold protein
MTKTIHATFHNGKLDPKEHLNLSEGQEVVVIIQTKEKESSVKPYSFFKNVSALDLDMPEDFSENFDDYTYRGKSVD